MLMLLVFLTRQKDESNRLSYSVNAGYFNFYQHDFVREFNVTFSHKHFIDCHGYLCDYLTA